MNSQFTRAWRIPAALIGLSLVPFAATINRLVWILSGGAQVDPAMDRFGGDWAMLAVHIVLGTAFLVLSAVQLSPELRARNRSWHRSAGKIAMICGIAAVLSGVWLVIAFPPSELATPFMDAVRIIFGTALAGAVVLAYRAIRRRDILAHRAWLIRAFALAIAGTTQALVIGLWLAIFGELTPESATALITIGFLINILIAEWRIRSVSNHTFSFSPQRRTI
ncbi:MAG: DUF2306 domain-containing protein [Pseudomonadota bacterium]